MRETFIKKYWIEDDVLFYLHFKNEIAIRQIEISNSRKTLLSQNHPVEGDFQLYDQSLSDLNLTDQDFISREEFEDVWTEK